MLFDRTATCIHHVAPLVWFTGSISNGVNLASELSLCYTIGLRIE